MNEILKKRIKEAAWNNPYHNHAFSEESFIEGATFVLQNLWIPVDEALPEYEEDVIVTNGKGDYWFSYRPTYDDVIVDRNGFNNPSNLNITHWMPIPQLKGGEK